MRGSRRDTLKLGMTAVLGLPLANAAGAASPAGQQALSSTPASPWASGIEGQRRADLGNGTYLNPIIAGDHSDPTVLKDGRDYYMTFSTSNSYPSLIVWHSRDLMNWRPVTAALSKPMGLVFAADLAKHNGRYFIYIPILPPVVGSGLGGGSKIFVIHANTISGPWSDPVDLGIEGFIDPGHIVGEDGKRYLFLNGVSRVRLTDDGLATAGAVEHVYDGWRYPDDWVTEAYALEGPKLLRHGEFFYLVSAVGGTAGAGHQPYGDRRACAVDQRSLGELSSQSDRPHEKRLGVLVVARACDPRRRTSERLVDDLPRLRERLSNARPTGLIGADRVDPGWVVPRNRGRPFAPFAQAKGRRGAVRRHRPVRRFCDPCYGHTVEPLRARRRRPCSHPACRQRARPERQGQLPERLLTPNRHRRRSRLRDQRRA